MVGAVGRDKLQPPPLSAYNADLRRLFFNYLRISPSYRLACLNQDKRLKPSMPPHTKAVLLSYRRFGDVWSKDFEDWDAPAPMRSGNPTRRVQALPPDAATLRSERNVTLVLVPNELHSDEKVFQFKAIVSADAVKRHLPVRPRTLWKNLAVVYLKARHPEAELWRIGLLAGAVERYKDLIDPWCPRKLARDAAERRHLTLIVIRLLKNALAVAENAAVGLFPSADREPWQQLQFPFADHRLDELLREAKGDEHLVVCQHLGLQLKNKPD